MNFEFSTASRIVFGSGSLEQLGKLAASMGSHALIALGLPKENATKLFELLEENHIKTTVLRVLKEPSVESIQEGVEFAKENQCDLVISYGGGSALDTGKAISILLNNPGNLIDYLEVIGKGEVIKNPPIPYFAIPTTSGTGAEVTRNAVIGSEANKVKVSLRSPMMMAKVVIVDPELTYSVPKPVTASTGLDAFTQVLEPFVSHFANPVTDAFCREGLMRASRSLKRAYDHGEDKEAREDMSITSLFGGIALSNAKLGAVHGFAGVLGGVLGASHGVICASLLANTISINVKALHERDPQGLALKRFDEVARIITGDVNATAKDGVMWIKDLCAHMNIPGLGTMGLKREDFADVIEKSAKSSSMKGNPIQLTYEELEEILNLSY